MEMPMGEAIRTWKEGLSTKPEGIRKIYRTHLDRFLERRCLTPEELLEMRVENLRSDDPKDRRRIEGMIIVQMAEMEERGEAPKICQYIWRSVHSFLEANGFELDLRAEDLHLGRYDDFQALPKQVREKIERSRRDWIISY
jgi:hypothetical protein